jgi:hypothetical protein
MTRLVNLCAIKQTGAPDETLAEWHLKLGAGPPEAIQYYVYQHPAGRKVCPRALMCVDCAQSVGIFLPFICLTIVLLQYWYEVGMWPSQEPPLDGSEEEGAEEAPQSTLLRKPVDDIPEVCTGRPLSTLTLLCHICACHMYGLCVSSSILVASA